MFIYPPAITITTEKKTSWYTAYSEDSTGKVKKHFYIHSTWPWSEVWASVQRASALVQCNWICIIGGGRGYLIMTIVYYIPYIFFTTFYWDYSLLYTLLKKIVKLRSDRDQNRMYMSNEFLAYNSTSAFFII
jgi:hypothetical protein